MDDRQITTDDTLVFCCDARTVVVRNEDDLAALVGVRNRERIVFCNNVLAHAATQKTRKDGFTEHFTGKKNSSKKPDDETRNRENREDDGQEHTDQTQAQNRSPETVFPFDAQETSSTMVENPHSSVAHRRYITQPVVPLRFPQDAALFPVKDARYRPSCSS